MNAQSWYRITGSATSSARNTITFTVIKNPSIAPRKMSEQPSCSKGALSGLSRRKSQ